MKILLLEQNKRVMNKFVCRLSLSLFGLEVDLRNMVLRSNNKPVLHPILLYLFIHLFGLNDLVRIL